jgi:cysteine synthase
MIEQAEKRGDITKDTVIIESSSGNTAIAIAMVAAMKGCEQRGAANTGVEPLRARSQNRRQGYPLHQKNQAPP